jgi:uncharacterized membrane protein
MILIDGLHAPLSKVFHLDRKSFVVLVVSIQSLVVASVILDLPAIRQVVGFLYLTIVPGAVLMRILKLRESTVVEHVSISVGLSISLVMLFGYAANELGLLMGIQNPLSLASLLFPLSIFVLISSAYIYFEEEEFKNRGQPLTSIGGARAWLAIALFVGLPFVSLLGSFLASSFSSITVLLCIIMVISAVFLLTVGSAKIVPMKLYPLALFAIAIALLLPTTMWSRYITGYDLHQEFYCFALTRISSSWTPSIFGVQTVENVGFQSYASMLSLTILPFFYSVVLNLSGELIFKVIYPIILSIVPVVLYYVYTVFFDERRAVLAVFFFVSYATFYIQMAYLARQMIAELFFALLLLLYAKYGFTRNRGRHSVLILFFFFGLIVSHYGLTYVAILYVLCFVLVTSAREHRLNKTGLTDLLLLLALALTWYVFSFSSAAVNDLAASLNRMIAGLADIFGGRDPNLLKAIGAVSLPSLWRRLGQYTFFALEILTVAGFLKLLWTRKRLGSNQFFFSGILASMLLLALSIAIPNFSYTLNQTRIFQIALFFLAPMLMLGSETLFNLIFRMLNHFHKGFSWGWVHRISLIFATLLIVVFFLFQSGFIFALVGDIPASPSLTTDKSDAALRNLSLYDSFTFSREVYGAKWALVNISNQSQIYCDLTSQLHVLSSYGLVNENRTHPLTQDLEDIDKNAYIYLRPLNTINHLIENQGTAWIMSENSTVLQNADRIYSNGGCEIFKGAGK